MCVYDYLWATDGPATIFVNVVMFTAWFMDDTWYINAYV